MGTRMTDEEGFFAFDSVPAGIYFLEVTLLGYGERRDTLRVEAGADLDVLVTLSVTPLPLEPILVEVRRLYVPAYRAGFEERRRFRSGTFFTREDIEARGAMHFSDLLRMVPGARVTPSARWGPVVTLRGGCRPQLWVDGVRTVTPLGMDDLLPPMDVDAVEVYHGAQTPAEFGGDACGTIVVWTRRGEPGPATGSFWRRLAVAVGFIAIAILLTR
jgi:outer membrane cobalamin receptor